MKIITSIIFGAAKRAFTKSNGKLIATTTPDGVWDLEATLAWFLRGLLAVALLYMAQRLEIDATVLSQFLSE